MNKKENEVQYQEMDSLYQLIEEAMLNSPLTLEEKMAVMMQFNFTLMRASRGNLVEMEVSDGSTISLKLERPRPLTH